MRAGGGSQKGSSFEREIAKKLSLWITGGKQGDCLWRTPSSGGRATVAYRKGEEVRQAGDLCAMTPEAYQFCADLFLELKHLKKCSLTQSLSGKGDLVRIWVKLVKQSKDHLRFPVLILRQNRKPTLFITGATVARMLSARTRGTIRNPVLDMHILFFDEVIKSSVPRGWRPK